MPPSRGRLPGDKFFLRRVFPLDRTYIITHGMGRFWYTQKFFELFPAKFFRTRKKSPQQCGSVRFFSFSFLRGLRVTRRHLSRISFRANRWPFVAIMAQRTHPIAFPALFAIPILRSMPSRSVHRAAYRIFSVIFKNPSASSRFFAMNWHLSLSLSEGAIMSKTITGLNPPLTAASIPLGESSRT